MGSFVIYNTRSEQFNLVSDVKGFVDSKNADAWDSIVSDVVKSERFLGLDDAADLLGLESPFDGDDGYMVAFSILSALSDNNIIHSVSFNEDCGSWGLLVECYDLHFVSIGLGSLVTCKDTGEKMLTEDLQRICSNVDQTIDDIMSRERNV